MTYIHVILDPISASPVWVAPTLEAAEAAGSTLEVRKGFEGMAAPIYRYEQVEGKKARNGIKVGEVPALAVLKGGK